MARRKKKTEDAEIIEQQNVSAEPVQQVEGIDALSEKEPAVSAGFDPYNPPHLQKESEKEPEKEPEVSAGFDPYNPPHLQKESEQAQKQKVKQRKSLNEIKEEAKTGDKDIADALEWMEILHKDDVDKAGVPYWLHPVAVMMTVKKIAAKSDLDEKTLAIAALLHDVVEDGHSTIPKIQARFGKAVADAVKVLTRDPKLTYMEYVAKVIASGSKTALAVKWADVMSNSSPRRLAKLSESDRNSLSKRYGNARKMLEKAWPLLKQMGEMIDLKRKERKNA